MAKAVGSWDDYVSRLEQEIRNHVDSEGFLHSSIGTPGGEIRQFRSISDIRAELNMARNEAARARINLGGSSPFFAECAP